MTRKGLYAVGLDKLEAALDTYGADRTRWPAPLRHALSGLIAGNTEAQRLMKDAEAFDRLLDEAPHYDMARLDGLAERIAAAAERQPRVVSSGTKPFRPVMRYHHGFAATALAASLVLGLFAGQSNAINALLGTDDSQPSVSQQIALTDPDVFLDEDML
jgi:hypothetical protein